MTEGVLPFLQSFLSPCLIREHTHKPPPLKACFRPFKTTLLLFPILDLLIVLRATSSQVCLRAPNTLHRPPGMGTLPLTSLSQKWWSWGYPSLVADKFFQGPRLQFQGIGHQSPRGL